MTDQSRPSVQLPINLHQHLSLSLSTPSFPLPHTSHLAMFLGRLVYCTILIVNAIAILSEDRFLARSTLLPHAPCMTLEELTTTVGWGRTQADPGFGATHDNSSVKAKSVNLIASVRTVMRSMFIHRHICQPRRRNSLANCFVSSAVPLIVINGVIIIYQLILG